MDNPDVQRQSDQPGAQTTDTRSQADQEAQRAQQEQERQRQARAANAWAANNASGAGQQSPRTRTRTTAETVPATGKAAAAMRSVGRAAGSAIMMVIKMIRELLQGLFGKITNKDLKGERDNLEQEIEARNKALNELQGAERDISRELKREQGDLKESREQVRTDEIKQTLRDVASGIAEKSAGASRQLTGGEAATDGVQGGYNASGKDNEVGSPNKLPGAGVTLQSNAGLSVHEDAWVTQVRQFDDGVIDQQPHDGQYLATLLGEGVRSSISKEAVDEVRRITESFVSACDSKNNRSIDDRFPRMLAAVAYVESVGDAVEAAVDSGDLSMPSQEDLQKRVVAAVSRIVHDMRERGDHADKWADSLVNRSRYNFQRLDDLSPALNQMGVRIREGGLAIGNDSAANEAKPGNGGLPGPKHGNGGHPKLG